MGRGLKLTAPLVSRVISAPTGNARDTEAIKLFMRSSSQTQLRWKSGSCNTPHVSPLTVCTDHKDSSGTLSQPSPISSSWHDDRYCVPTRKPLSAPEPSQAAAGLFARHLSASGTISIRSSLTKPRPKPHHPTTCIAQGRYGADLLLRPEGPTA